MLQKIGEIENVPKYIDRAKDRNDNFRLLGFGHRIFKAWDPRAKILKSMCVEILNKYHDKRAEKLYILSDAIEQFVAKDKYFIDRKIYPNLDLYSGICEMALGIPVNMFTVIFAVARSIGWIANWSEFMSDEN